MAAFDIEVHLDIDEIIETLKEQGWRPVKHGRWLFKEYPDGYYHSTCSECDAWSDEYAYQDGWNFCPHCGAKMDEEE